MKHNNICPALALALVPLVAAAGQLPPAADTGHGLVAAGFALANCREAPPSGTTSSTAVPLAGDGTADSPYLITSATDWNSLAGYMTSASATFSGQYIKIAADLDFSETGITALPSLNGDLDGDSHTLSGINAAVTAEYSGAVIATAGTGSAIHDFAVDGSVSSVCNYSGAVIGETYGTVSNITSRITLTDSSSTLCVAGVVGYAGPAANVTGCTYSGECAAAGYYTAGVVGYGYEATITDCSFTGTITGTSYYASGVVGYCYGAIIARCTTSGAVTSTSYYPSGVVGCAYYSTIYNCVNSGTVSSSYIYAAGVVGYCQNGIVSGCDNSGTLEGTQYYYGGVICYPCQSTVTGCTNSGNVKQTGNTYAYTGGVVGITDSLTVVTDCQNTGTVSARGTNTGGVVGYNQYGTISSCQNSGTVTSTSQIVGGVIGHNIYGNIYGCLNTGSVEGDGYCGGVLGYSKYGEIADCVNDTAAAVGGTGTYTAGVIGYTAFDSISGAVNRGKVTIADEYGGGVAGFAYDSKIYHSLNYGAVESSGSYTGGFAGKVAYGKISYCCNYGPVSSSAQFAAGFAGECTFNPTFNYCGNEGSVTYTGTATQAYAAGFAAYSEYCTYNYCYNSGDIAATSPDTGYLTGFLGYCYTAIVSDKFYLTGCYNTADVTSACFTAGLVGYAHNTVEVNMDCCYNTGNITSTSTTATEAFTAGLSVYYTNKADITGCYNTGNVSSLSGDYTGGLFAFYAGSTGTYSANSSQLYVTGCYNTGDVTAAGDIVGGIAAYMYKYITLDSCYNTGTIAGANNVGGLAGTAYGKKVAKIYRSYNAGSIVASGSFAGGIVGHSSYKDVATDCFNTGDITAATSCAGGIAGLGALALTNVYNTGNITAGTYAGGLVGQSKAGSYTTISTGYSTGKVAATTDPATCGNILGNGTDNASYWNSSNSITGTYYLADCETECVDTASTAMTRAQLAALDLGEGWTAGDNYTYPRLATVATAGHALVNAATVIPAGDDTYTSISQAFNIGTPDGVTWTASSDAVSIDGNSVTFVATLQGELTMTATAGEASASTTLTCDVEVDGILATATNKAHTVATEKLYTTDGKLAGGTDGSHRAIYIVARTYDDGSTSVTKEVR